MAEAEAVAVEARSAELVMGRLSFGQYVRETRGYWRRRAESIGRRWAGGKYGRPAWLEVDDLEQEMLLQAWLASEKYEAGKGPTPLKYMEFGARRRVEKVICRARGVEQHTRKGPPRFEVAFAEFGDAEPDATVPAEQERLLAREFEYAVLKGLCDTRVEREVVEALEKRGGSLAAAAAFLWERGAAFGLRTEGSARRLVESVVEVLAARYGEESGGGNEAGEEAA